MKKTCVTSGTLKGRQLAVAGGIRPTQERVRKALFDVLQQVIEGGVFLELYAGSGAVGIEALSNGACEVVFVEKDVGCQKVIKNNIAMFGLGLDKADTSILSMDSLAAIDVLAEKKKQFDIIFLDPPYYGDHAKNTLQKLSSCDILAPHCTIVVEHNKKDILEVTIDKLTCFKQKRYGDTMLSFYRAI